MLTAASFNTRIERTQCAPWGLEGGHDAVPNRVFIRRADGLRVPPNSALLITIFSLCREVLATPDVAAKQARTNNVSRIKNALGQLTATFARWQQQADHIPHPDLAEMVLEESGYTDMLKADKSPESAGRLENPAPSGNESVPHVSAEALVIAPPWKSRPAQAS